MTTILHHLALPDAVFANPALSILLPVVVGGAVGYSTRPDPNDAEVHALKQPPLRPPPAAFGPVWGVLYGLTGYAAHLALGRGRGGFGGTDATDAVLYTVQLGLNLAWMPLFFRLHQPVVATVDAAALLVVNTVLAARWLGSPDEAVSAAGLLWLPYVAWVGFATYLSAGVGYLNGWHFGSGGRGSAAAGAEKKATQ